MLIHENLYIHVHVILVYAIHGNHVLTLHVHPGKPVHPRPCDPRVRHPWEPHANLARSSMGTPYIHVHGNHVLTLHYINHWQLFCWVFFKIFRVGFMGFPCVMYTCVNSKYTHSVLAPTTKGTVPALSAKGTLIIVQPCYNTSWALAHHPWELCA